MEPTPVDDQVIVAPEIVLPNWSLATAVKVWFAPPTVNVAVLGDALAAVKVASTKNVTVLAVLLKAGVAASVAMTCTVY